MTVAFLEQVAITCRSTWSYSNFNNSRIAQILQQSNYAMVHLPANKQLLHPIFAQIPQLPMSTHTMQRLPCLSAYIH